MWPMYIALAICSLILLRSQSKRYTHKQLELHIRNAVLDERKRIARVLQSHPDIRLCYNDILWLVTPIEDPQFQTLTNKLKQLLDRQEGTPLMPAREEKA